MDGAMQIDCECKFGWNARCGRIAAANGNSALRRSRLIQQWGSDPLDFGLDCFDWLCGVNHMDAAAGFRRLCQKAFAEPLTIIVPLTFHAVQRPLQSTVCRGRRHIEQKYGVWRNSVDRQLADGSNCLELEPASVSLVDKIGEEITVRNDRFFCRERRPDYFTHELSSSCHVEQHLGAAANRRLIIAMEQNLTNPLSQSGAARIAAGNHVLTTFFQPCTEQIHLSCFADSVDAIKGKKHVANMRIESYTKELPSPLYIEAMLLTRRATIWRSSAGSSTSA